MFPLPSFVTSRIPPLLRKYSPSTKSTLNDCNVTSVWASLSSSSCPLSSVSTSSHSATSSQSLSRKTGCRVQASLWLSISLHLSFSLLYSSALWVYSSSRGAASAAFALSSSWTSTESSVISLPELLIKQLSLLKLRKLSIL